MPELLFIPEITIHAEICYSRQSYYSTSKSLFMSENTIHAGITIHVGKYYSYRNYYSHRNLFFYRYKPLQPNKIFKKKSYNFILTLNEDFIASKSRINFLSFLLSQFSPSLYFFSSAGKNGRFLPFNSFYKS